MNCHSIRRKLPVAGSAGKGSKKDCIILSGFDMYRVYDWIYSESGIGGGKRQTFQIDCSSDEGDNTSTKDQIKAGSIGKRAGNQTTENPCKKRSKKKTGTKETEKTAGAVSSAYIL